MFGKKDEDLATRYADGSLARQQAGRAGLAGTKNRQRAALGLEADQTTLLAQILNEVRRTNELLTQLATRSGNANIAPPPQP